MAFAFLVEDGSGLASANSYVSVEDADDYLVTNIHVFPIWDALTTENKQYLLAWASTYLDQRARWNGKKAVETSGLRFPRECLTDRDGNPIASDVVPVALKQATVEMARALIESDRSADRGQDGLERLRVDVIEIYFNADYRLPTVPKNINMILEGLGTVRSDTGFGRILRV